MKYLKPVAISLFSALIIVAGVVYANSENSKKPVVFYSGHTHNAGGTQGAPSHSGGTDSAGCHNKSVPYHCH